MWALLVFRGNDSGLTHNSTLFNSAGNKKLSKLRALVVYSQPKLERVMGIEPTSSAWKAEVLPLNYTRSVRYLFPGIPADTPGGSPSPGPAFLAGRSVNCDLTLSQIGSTSPVELHPLR